VTTNIVIEGELPPERHEEAGNVDLAVLACGYESRARAFAERLDFGRARRCALAFPDQRQLAYERNAAVLEARGFELIALPDDAVRDWFKNQVAGGPADSVTHELRVFVDISSQSRARIAAIVEGIAREGERRPVRAYVGYTLAAYVDPPSIAAPNVRIGPVSPYFAGWTFDPDLPLSLIAGLGYEPERALGAVEYLEPSSVWALMPHSQVRRYERSLRAANALLLADIREGQVLTYRVEDPNATLSLLFSLISHLRRTSSVLLLRSGPKILVLLCMLISCIRRDVAVWRVSAGADDPAVDRKPAGEQFIVECSFAPQEDDPDDNLGARLE
jgi:hypothetical protein